MNSFTLDHLLALNREILALSAAKVPLDQGLLRVAQECSGPTAALAERIAERTSSGASLSEALNAEGAALPISYLSVVQAGIQSGNLTAALEGYGQTAERIADLRRVALLAAFYPLLVIFLAWVLLLFVGHALLQQLDWIGINNRFWLSSLRIPGDWLWILSLLLPAILLVVYAAWWRRSANAVTLSAQSGAWLNWIPGVARIRQLGCDASFADLLGLFVTHHMPLQEALPLAADASGGRELSQAAHELGRHLSEGDSLTIPADVFRILPPLVRLALADGRSPQTLSTNLRRAAASYQLRAQRLANRVTFYFPLALTAIVGGVAVGLYAFLLLQPYAASLREIAQW